MLGIGQDVDDQGHPLGTQISLFDVSDLAPEAAAAASLGQGWSEAESDHHAFLFWPRTGLVVVPFDEQARRLPRRPRAGIGRSAASPQPAARVHADDPPLDGRRRLRAHGLGRGRRSRAASPRSPPQGWAAFPAVPAPTPVPVPVVPNAGTASVGAPTKR